MRWMIAVDPGLRACGVAIFDAQRQGEPKLLRAAYVKGPHFGVEGLCMPENLPPMWDGMRTAVNEWIGKRPLDTHLVVEMPRIYPAARQTGNQNDLVNLAGTVAAVSTLLVETRTLVYPRDWKGTLDPDSMIERIQKRLSPEETARVELPSAASLHHNVWDAVGIGLHAVGRLEPRKVFPR